MIFQLAEWLKKIPMRQSSTVLKKQGYEYQVSTINNGWTLVLLRIFNPGAHDLEMKLEISCNT